jgi:DNA-binding transcriptional LysR family regulator
VRDKTLDLAVSIKPDPKREPALRFRPLFAMDVAVVARKGHRLRHAHSLTELLNADWLTLLPPPTSGTPLDRLFSAVGLPGPQAVVECDSHTTLVSLLAKTDMLGTLSRRLLVNPLVRDSLDEIQVVERLPALTVGIVTRVATPLGAMESFMARAFAIVARKYARLG